MRAWLLLLAVLATFQTFVPVASTEDNNISSAFIRAIQPIKEDINYKTTTAIQISTPKTTALTTIVDFQTDFYTEKEKDIKIKKTNVHKTDKNVSDKIASEKVLQRDYNKNNKKIAVKNFKVNEQVNDFENEVIEKNHKNFDKKQNKNYKNHNNKMALKESELIEQQEQKQNQIDTTTIHNKEEDLKQITKNSSSAQHKHHHQQHHHHQHHHHQHQHQSQPASQKQKQTTSDNLTSSTTTPSSASSSSSTSISSDNNNNSGSTTPQTSSIQNHNAIDDTTTTTSSSPLMELKLSITENDDGAISVESQQPQLDAVIIPDEGPRTYSNQEIIAEKVKPDKETLVEIENSLLSLFNMKRPPKIDRSKIVIPEAMKKLYAQVTGHELNSINIPKPGLLTKSANTVRSFTHQESKIDDRFPHHHRFRLFFDINSIPAEEKLKAAELQLSRDAISHIALNPRQANRIRYQVLVYDITRVGVKGKREPSYLLLDNKTIRLNSTDVVSVDVKPAVDRWLASPNSNFGLLIEVRTSRTLKPAPHHHVRLRRSADEDHEKWENKKPLLLTYTDDERHKSRSVRDVSKRSKRAGHHRKPYKRKNNDKECQRRELRVDFADVGWSDWIVAPEHYEAYYCQGRCPFLLSDHLNSTNHAVVQTLVNNISPGRVPKACCVPTELEGISMLYLNDQRTVVLKNYQDMTVVGCGCR